jgi:hypothetical protein
MDRSRNDSLSYLWLACAALACAGLARAADSASSATPPAAPPAKEAVARLVAELGSADWAAREAAEKQLAGYGPEVLAALDPLLARAADREVLWRLEKIYRSLIPEETYAGANPGPGFLGVSFQVVSSASDGRLADRQWGILVQSVEPESAALKAGLALEDLIVAIDGETFIGDLSNGQNSFVVDLIQRHGEGATVKVTFYRDQELREVAVTLGSPRQVVQFQGLTIPQSSVARVKDHYWKKYWQKHLEDLRVRFGQPPAKSAASEKTTAPAAPKTEK